MSHDTGQDISAYIHIPFCEHICYYCDFNKVFLEGQPVDEYIEMLLREMTLQLEKTPVKSAPTLYVGGGTPTSLTAKQLERLLSGIVERFPMETVTEFTVEANPGDLTADKLAVMQNYQVNRLSMGVQTFDDRLLKKIGRRHTSADVYETMAFLEKADFRNVSIDLIYALPGQTLAGFRETLQRAIELDLPHYSLYSLILENKTMFMNWVRQGRLTLPDQEEESQMFEETILAMEKAGRKQYEISNFALAGKESEHNKVYWHNEHYFGFGAGASGYVGDTRYKNFGPIQHYLSPLRENKLPVYDKETLTVKSQMEEEMFLGLRLKEGVSASRFAEKFQRSIQEVYGKVLAEEQQAGLLEVTGDRIRLTETGLLIGNDIFERFLIDE
ncbi:radical SAM family heme chaperone HemW [Candidatus Enterococcus leclercqii]|uniref:radical SAM family heme chaperone HemW n=1 Tax=Candidatus Enterococcus leclercqii TaxID=1857218 RepID=UPI00137B3F1C|nr:radical SAM family heme chaperone HemW [Enterococcus sp. CU9D]KAF1292061.1 coproporphyrinogen III oxidase [Enterococcus sp. CU9D]